MTEITADTPVGEVVKITLNAWTGVPLSDAYYAGVPDAHRKATAIIQQAFDARDAAKDARIADLEAERDDAREDAARYHWLRDNSCPPHNFYISVPDEFHGVRYSPASVDAYIDAARAALNGGSHGK